MDKNDKSIFNYIVEFNVTSKVGEEYLPMIEDIVKMVMLQFFIQLMLFVRNPYEHSVFDSHFLEIIIYLVLALCVYWLLFKRLVKLT
jgi:hypothetical protein|uniref:Uncharacterized protein n=1 Tax=viral metagenome TaxID=1070528 RepID=A0A6C0BPZ8_9ZZZZ